MGWRDRAAAALSTACGLGYAPVAPGTAGTLLGVGIYLLVALTTRGVLQSVLLAAVLLAACAAAVPLGRWAQKHWGRPDPRRFVLDEVAGFLLTVLLFRTGDIWLTAAWAFLASRFFDIIKPPPARQAEKLTGGWGILADDLVASLYAAAALHVLRLLVPCVVGAG